MTEVLSISRSQILARRQQLRRQRLHRRLQTLWRSLSILGLAGGLIWVITLPGWVLQMPDQVIIRGNRFLSSQAIKDLLPLSFPQSLLTLEPQLLARQLKTTAPISKVMVSRQIFPPQLTIAVIERIPVAVTTSAELANLVAQNSVNLATLPKAQLNQLGLVDREGYWMSAQIYASLLQTNQLPRLRVIGLTSDRRRYWPDFYSAIQNGGLQVTQADWRNPSNLILITEIGVVHIGSYAPSRFPKQLKAAQNLRSLDRKLKPEQIAYIDLRDPDQPSIVLKQPSPTPQPAS